MNEHAMGQMGKEEKVVLEDLRRQLMPLLYNMERLQRDMAMDFTTPPDWPSIQQNIASLNLSLSSLQAFLNPRTDGSNPKRRDQIKSLHPYPISPLPVEKPQYAGLLSFLLRKRLDVNEENWINDRLDKASEFAHVPEEWGVQRRKPKADAGADDNDGSDGSDGMNGVEGQGVRVKRDKSSLDENELTEIWNSAIHLVTEATERVGQAQRAKGGEGESPEDESSEEVSPEESQDVSMGGMDLEPDVAVFETQLAGAPAKSTTAPAPPPMMPLESLHKFMTIGTVQR